MNATTATEKKKKTAPAAPVSMNADIYTVAGKKTGTLALPENIFGVAWNDSLMHQVVTSMQANARPHVAHAKDRGEVRGGGKKPWRQKGTGRARHGSIRSPIWRGGGVTHGPLKDKVYAREIPKKMRAKALAIALSRKWKEGKILFVDSLGLSQPKTAAAHKALVTFSKISGFEKITTKPQNAALIAVPDDSVPAHKSFRNIGNVLCMNVRNLNPVTVLGNSYLVIESPEAAVAIISQRMQKKAKAST